MRDATSQPRHTFDSLPDSGFIRSAGLLAPGPLPFSRTMLWRLVKAGSFPAPVKLAGGVTAWHVGAIRGWLLQAGGCNA